MFLIANIVTTSKALVPSSDALVTTSNNKNLIRIVMASLQLRKGMPSGTPDEFRPLQRTRRNGSAAGSGNGPDHDMSHPIDC